MLQTLRSRARALKAESLAMYVAIRDPRTPALARVIAGLVVAYALSPIDLIPDFIPVLGLLDDLVLLPLGIALAIRMIPPLVMADARRVAADMLHRPRSNAAAMIIVLIWLSLAVVCSVVVLRHV